MTKIQKVVRDIENLQDFYKRTKLLRARIKKKGLGCKKIEHAGPNGYLMPSFGDSIESRNNQKVPHEEAHGVMLAKL